MRDIKDKYQFIWEPLQRLLNLKLYSNYSSYDDDDDGFSEEYYDDENLSESESEEENEIIEITKGVNLEYYLAVTMPDIIKDRSFILEMILSDKHAEEYANLLKLWNDRYFIMELLQYYPKCYAHISNELKKDKQILCLALKDVNSDALKFASEELRNDREIAIMAIDNIGARALEHLSENLRGDAELVLFACRTENHQPASRTPTNLFYATQSLLNNKDFFKKVIQINGDYLRCASLVLKADRELVLEAIKNYGPALSYSPKLRLDRYFVLEAVGVNSTCLYGAGLKFLEDREIILCAVKQNGLSLKYAGYECTNDREIVLCAVKQNGLALQFASRKLRNDPEIVSEALKQNENATSFLMHE